MHFPAKFRIVPLVLAALIFMNCLGVYLIAFTLTGIHRIAERCDGDEITTTLTISASDWNNVNWIGERDFIYNGNVYDLQHAKKIGKQIVLTCGVDQEETSVCKQVQKNNENDHSTIPSALKDIYKFSNECDGISICTFNLHSISFSSFDPRQNSDLNSMLITVAAPPPRVA